MISVVVRSLGIFLMLLPVLIVCLGLLEGRLILSPMLLVIFLAGWVAYRFSYCEDFK